MAAVPVAADELSVVRAGVFATAGGFWFVSLAPVIVAGAGIHGVTVALWRAWIGLAMFGAVVIARRQLSWSIIRRCAPSGICFGASIGLFFWASQLTSIANASLLTVLQPVVLLVAGIVLFGERVVWRHLILGAVAIVGAIAIVLAGDSGGNGDIRGDLLAIASVVLGSGYFIFGKRVLETVDVTPFMVGVFVWAAALLSLAAIISSEPFVPDKGGDWVRVCAVAAGSGAGHYLLNFAQNKAPLNLMGVIQLLVPVNASLLAYWFLDQSVSALQVIAMTVVIGAVAMQTLDRTTS